MSVPIPAVHPLQPLFELEITNIQAAIDVYLAAQNPPIGPQSDCSTNDPPTQPADQLVYMEVLLKEPQKQYVLDFNAGVTTTVTRQARVLLYQNTTNFTYEVILDLDNAGGAIIATNGFNKLKFIGYPNNNFVNNADNDPFGSTGANVNFNHLSRAQMNATCMANPALVAKLNARGITTLTDDPKVTPGYYAYPFYTFEALRNFSGCCGKLCPDLVDLDAPNHRYYPTVFFNQSIVPGGICIETANWGLLDDLYVIFDCTDNSIYRIIEDTKNVPRTVPVPPAVSDPYKPLYHPPMQPIYYAQPQVSFTHPNNDQYAVEWDNWSFRWSYQRGGLSLYNIKYWERSQAVDPLTEPRSIAYKAACSDTIVIYNVAEPLVARTYVSADSHNWPVLPRLAELVPGRDVPCYVTDANLYDVVLAEGCGEPTTLAKVVAIYEQDADIMWRVNQGVIDGLNWPRGYDSQDPSEKCPGRPAEGARKRQLVVRTIFSGFYYLFVYTYIFNQDGTMEMYTDLQGQTTNQWVVADTTGKEVDNGHRIAKQQVALLHTHSSMYRIDFDIDGTSNVASEANAFRICDKVKNPCGDAIEAAHHHFHTELEAIRSLNQKHNRVWEVSNENSKNCLGFPRGYAVYFAGPNGNSSSLCTPNSAAHTHFPWMAHDLYVTKYRYGEEYASGEFPVLNVEPVGLSKYVKGDAHIENEDIVMWFNCKFFHEPHTENYPFITGHRIGLLLTPENFFDFNPACSINWRTETVTAGTPITFDLCTQETEAIDFTCCQ